VCGICAPVGVRLLPFSSSTSKDAFGNERTFDFLAGPEIPLGKKLAPCGLLIGVCGTVETMKPLQTVRGECDF